MAAKVDRPHQKRIVLNRERGFNDKQPAKKKKKSNKEDYSSVRNGSFIVEVSRRV